MTMTPAIAAGVAATRPRHSAVVRVTHWLTTVSFIALVVSGGAILIVHPRLYWGETGALGTPALIDLPLPHILGPSGWGRYLHFLSAWVSVLTGVAYVAAGISSGHFRRALVPAVRELRMRALARVVADHMRWRMSSDGSRYNALQQ